VAPLRQLQYSVTQTLDFKEKDLKARKGADTEWQKSKKRRERGKEMNKEVREIDDRSYAF